MFELLNVFHFVTEWFFRAPIDKVWQQVTDVRSYPTKWPIWKSAVFRGSERELQLGSVIDYVGRGPVPYSARFTFEITVFQPPRLMAYESSGDLVGKGRWVLQPHSGGTLVTSCWDVGTSIVLFDCLASLPFVKPIMRKHHDYVMAKGYRGFKAELEGKPS